MTPSEETQTPRHHQAGNLPNTHVHKPTPRLLVTGPHTVSDISCVLCGTVLGWKYVDAKELGQRYKIGKFILETKRVVIGVSWEDGIAEEGEEEDDDEEEKLEGVDDGEDVVVFDSEDEDECEDLFAGIWDPEVAAKKRGRRVARRKVDMSV